MTYSVDEISNTFGISEKIAEQAVDNLTSGNSILVSFSGKIGSGKDTVAPLVFELEGFEDVSHRFFARGVKEEVETIFKIIRCSENFDEAVNRIIEIHGVSEQDAFQMGLYLYDEVRENLELTSYIKTKKVRSSLQYWGTDTRRKQDDNYWVKKTMRHVFKDLAEGLSVSMTDSRFPNEMDAIVKYGGKAVRLNVSEEEQARRIMSRDNVVVTEEARSHISETALDNYPHFHAIVDTDGKSPQEVAVEAIEKLRGNNV